MSIPTTRLLNYPRTVQVYFSVLEILFRNHMELMLDLRERFLPLFSTVLDGLRNFSLDVSSQCCCSIDHVLSFRFNIDKKKSMYFIYFFIWRGLLVVSVLTCNWWHLYRLCGVVFIGALTDSFSPHAIDPLNPVRANRQARCDQDV